MRRVVLDYPHAALEPGSVVQLPGVEDVAFAVGPWSRDPYDPCTDTVAGFLDEIGWTRIDCFLQVTPEYRALPSDVFELGCHVALGVGDWNVAGRMLRLLAPLTSVALTDPPGVPVLQRLGFARVEPAFLWGWNPTAWTPVDPAAPRDIDVLFVGSRNPAIHGERERWLARLGKLARRHDVRIRAVPHDRYRELAARARLIFNFSVRGEANLRAFEGPVAGACVLNERGNPSLPYLFEPDVDYATYDEDDFEDVVDALLADERRRLAIATAGQAAALPQTYLRRAADLWRSTAVALDGAALPPPVARRRAVHVLARQWRLARTPAGREDAALRLVRADDPAGADARLFRTLAALDDPGADGARLTLATAIRRGDPIAHLAYAEAALRVGAANEALYVALHGLEARPVADAAALPTPDFGPWRMLLERAVLAAETDAGAEAAADAWLRRRLGAIVVSAAGTLVSPEEIEQLLQGDDLPAQMLHVRATSRQSCGRFAEALADARRVVELLPFDPGARRALARLLLALGDREGAAAELRDLADSLAAVGADAGGEPSLSVEADAIAATETRAIARTADLRPGDAGALVVARAAGAVPGTRLEILCADPAALAAAAAEIAEALAEAGVDPDAVPDTAVLVAGESAAETFDRARRVSLVVARLGSEGQEAARMGGIPVLDAARLGRQAATASLAA